MTQLGKFEKYLIEEFFDDYRAGAMTQRTFTRRVAFITGSMAAAAAAMPLVGCTPRKFRAAPTPCRRRRRHLFSGDRHSIRRRGTGGQEPAVRSGGRGRLVTATVSFPPAERKSAAIWPGRKGTSRTCRAGLPREPRPDAAYPGRGAPLRQGRLCGPRAGPAQQGRRHRESRPGRRAGSPDPSRGATPCRRLQGRLRLLELTGLRRRRTDRHDRLLLRRRHHLAGGDGAHRAEGNLGVLWTRARSGQGPDHQAGGPWRLRRTRRQDHRRHAGTPDALDATEVRHELKVYPGVDHAFHNDTGERYNEAQATAAWNDTLAWFSKYV